MADLHLPTLNYVLAMGTALGALSPEQLNPDDQVRISLASGIADILHRHDASLSKEDVGLLTSIGAFLLHGIQRFSASPVDDLITHLFRLSKTGADQ